MNKKYEFTGETKVIFGVTLKRIRALVEIGTTVYAGDVGGWVENINNLSMYGNAWVSDNACVSGDACVCGNALVYGNAWVSDNACVSGDACVCGNALVYGNAWVSDNACVYGNARVSDNACVCGNALVYGNARVSGDACVYGNARVSDSALVSDNARVSGDASILWISKVGPELETITAYRNNEDGITVTRGCFIGTIEEFRSSVIKRHAGTKHEFGYLGLANYIEWHFNDLHGKNK